MAAPLKLSWNAWRKGYMETKQGFNYFEAAVYHFNHYTTENPYCTKMLYEQILEAAAHKTATVQPLTSHLTNYPSKTRYTWLFWWNKDKLIPIIYLWTLTHGHTSVEWPAKTYINQFGAKHWMPTRGLMGWIAGKSQRDQRCWYILIMMIIY